MRAQHKMYLQKKERAAKETLLRHGTIAVHMFHSITF